MHNGEGGVDVAMVSCGSETSLMRKYGDGEQIAGKHKRQQEA